MNNKKIFNIICYSLMGIAITFILTGILIPYIISSNQITLFGIITIILIITFLIVFVFYIAFKELLKDIKE